MAEEKLFPIRLQNMNVIQNWRDQLSAGSQVLTTTLENRIVPTWLVNSEDLEVTLNDPTRIANSDEANEETLDINQTQVVKSNQSRENDTYNGATATSETVICTITAEAGKVISVHDLTFGHTGSFGLNPILRIRNDTVAGTILFEHRFAGGVAPGNPIWHDFGGRIKNTAGDALVVTFVEATADNCTCFISTTKKAE